MPACRTDAGTADTQRRGGEERTGTHDGECALLLLVLGLDYERSFGLERRWERGRVRVRLDAEVLVR